MVALHQCRVLCTMTHRLSIPLRQHTKPVASDCLPPQRKHDRIDCRIACRNCAFANPHLHFACNFGHCVTGKSFCFHLLHSDTPSLSTHSPQRCSTRFCRWERITLLLIVAAGDQHAIQWIRIRCSPFMLLWGPSGPARCAASVPPPPLVRNKRKHNTFVAQSKFRTTNGLPESGSSGTFANSLLDLAW